MVSPHSQLKAVLLKKKRLIKSSLLKTLLLLHCTCIDRWRSNEVTLKGTKFLQDMSIFLWQFELSCSWPLCGEQGQTEHLAEGRVDGPHSVGVQGCRLTRSPCWPRGQGRLPCGPLWQLLLIVVIVILLWVIIVFRKCHFLGAA